MLYKSIFPLFFFFFFLILFHFYNLFYWSCYRVVVLQIIGFSIAVIFFALMRQSCAWDRNLPIPSMLKALESNLRFPIPFIYLAIAPIGLSLLAGFWISQPSPSFASFTLVSVVCYFLANGFIAILILISQFTFYGTALLHIFIKKRSVSFHCFPFIHNGIND